jgi:hypothetical protein
MRRMDYYNGVQGFINYATSILRNISGGGIRYPCRRFQNKKFLHLDVVTMHLLHKGFMEEYHLQTLSCHPFRTSLVKSFSQVSCIFLLGRSVVIVRPLWKIFVFFTTLKNLHEIFVFFTIQKIFFHPGRLSDTTILL